MTLSDLTETVLRYNHHTPPAEAPDGVLARTRTSLHHHHLPKSVSEGPISCEPDREHAEATEQLEEVRPTVSAILDADPELETPVEL